MQELGGKYAISDKFSLFHFPHFTFFCTFAPALDFPPYGAAGLNLRIV